MKFAFLRIGCFMALASALSACQTGQTQLVTPAPVPQDEWTTSLVQAGQEVSAGRYAVADHLLADYSTHNPATNQATESLYWRALYKLDPANPNASTSEASVLLDNYLAASTGTHRTEAGALRRMAGLIESQNAAAAAVVAASAQKPDPAKVADDKAKDEELQRVKDELTKANAELDRIKRRLAQPKP
jgi:hypothetical protein